jgi:hypothetical protein
MRPKDESAMDKIIDDPRSTKREIAAAVQAKAIAQIANALFEIKHVLARGIPIRSI